MTTRRPVVALIVGVATAALAATAAFLLLSGNGDVVAIPRLLWSLPVIGVIATAPGWVIALLVFLPVVTHRVARKPIAAASCYLVAAVAGGVSPLMSPLGIMAVTSGNAGAIFPVLVACGSVGGLCFAACWHAIVLKSLAQRRATSWESFNG